MRLYCLLTHMSNPSKIVVVSPFFNEGEVVTQFLELLQQAVKNETDQYHFVMVDDCSMDNTLSIAQRWQKQSSNITFHLLTLQYNVGHQLALQQGCLYAKELEPDSVIVLDSDGEDNPAIIPAITAQLKSGLDIIHVKRAKRNESLLFKVFYRLYRLLFKTITGHVIDYGNYSGFGHKVLNATCNSTFNHFAAFCSRMRLNRGFVKTDRLARLDGKSKLSFSSLVFHGLNSLVEFADKLLIFFFKIFIVVVAISGISLLNIIYQKFISLTSILGWFSMMSFLLLIFILMAFGFLMTGLMIQNMLVRLKQTKPIKIYSVVKVQN